MQSSATYRRLQAERDRAATGLADLQAELASVIAAADGANGDDEHDPEGATVGFERARLAALVAASQLRLQGLDRAFQRLRAGTYGTCEACGRAIPPQRLAARPDAGTCVTCAAAGVSAPGCRRGH